LASAGPSTKPSRLSTEQQREVNRLLTAYRQAGADVEKKAKIVEQAVEIGPAAAKALLVPLDRDLQAAHRHYSGRFQQQAAMAVKKHLRNVERKEVEQLRETVLGLQKLGEGFTKEAIVAKGDPALGRLQRIFILGRSEVLKDSEDLQEERKRLVGLGSLHDKCKNLADGERGEVKLPASKPAPGSATFEQRLQEEEQRDTILAMPMDPQAKATLSANATLAEKLDPEEARAILALNITRCLLGLRVLAIDLGLCEAAREHSQDMEKLKFFSHESPLEGKKSPWDRAKLKGTTASAENIIAGQRDGKGANMAWFHSPGHHKNMLGDHARVGIGRSGTHYTEMCGK
jgi:uncharacterized protein YkwD